MNSARHILLAVSLLTLSGCGHPLPYGPDIEARMLQYSPNGAAIGVMPCVAAVDRWFADLDAQNSGRITRARFFIDADRQFAVMDLDHDGFITAAELSAYRRPFEPAAPQTWMQQRREQTAEPLYGSRMPGMRRNQGENDPYALPEGAGLAANRPDPVMAADANLDYRVSRAEFLAQAALVFARLDADGDGVLTRTEAERWCAAP